MGAFRSPVTSRIVRIGVRLGSVLAAALLLWHFHDRFWYPSDEGIYANIAERLLSGQTLNVQVQNLHPGYAAFVNVAAFRLFGVDLLSLRYPLIASALLGSCAVFALLRRRSLLFAVIGSLGVTAVGVIQFLNPTPNWYCLSLALGLAWWLTTVPPRAPARLIGAGFLVGLIGLFRQVTGVWVAMAVVTIALIEEPDPSADSSWLARLTLAVVLIVTVAVLVLSGQAEPGASVLFAGWPVAILLVALWRVRITNRGAALVLLQIAAGAAIAAIPLLLYCIVHRSAPAWFSDNVTAAFRLGAVVEEANGGPWYLALLGAAAFQVIQSLEPVKVANGLYWMILVLLAGLNGVLAVRRLARSRDMSDLALPILAGFYGLVALFMQDAIYLYFTTGLTLTSVLWMIAPTGPLLRAVGAGCTALLVVVGVTYHAGQPYTRTNLQALEGQRTVTSVEASRIPRCSLQLGAAESEPYRRLVELVQRAAPAGEPIAAFPSDAELYFLANRPNPFRFYNSAIGIRTPGDIEEAVQILERESPQILTVRPADKYYTPASRVVVERVRSRYERLETIGGVDVYRLKRR